MNVSNSPIQTKKEDGDYQKVIENIDSSIIFYFSGDKLVIYYNDLPTSILFDVIDYCKKNRLFSNRIINSLCIFRAIVLR